MKKKITSGSTDSTFHMGNFCSTGADTFTPQDLASTSVCYLASNRYEDASKEAVMATESMASWILVSHALFVVVIFLLLWLV